MRDPSGPDERLESFVYPYNQREGIEQYYRQQERKGDGDLQPVKRMSKNTSCRHVYSAQMVWWLVRLL